MDIQELLKLLPHRYPMLLVDRIIEVSEDGNQCKGLKNVTINEPFFQGHYPGIPIMPGVLILEAMAQVGAALVLTKPELKGHIPLIGTIDEVKFRRPVVPGDTLITQIDLLWVRMSAGVGKVRAVGRVDGEVVASMEMTFKLLPAGEATP